MSNKYDLIQNFDALESNIAELSHLLLTSSRFISCVFRLPDVLKGNENDEIAYIHVEKLTGTEALIEIKKHINLLFIQDKLDSISNKSAVRLPGVICIQTDFKQYQQFQIIIDTINTLKAQIKQTVTQIEASHRFEFIRDSLHGLLTLNTYRMLTSLSDVDTIRFGWANKKVINKVTHEEILNRLQASLESLRPPINLSKEQWEGQIMQEIAMIKALPYEAILKIQRPVKVQPIARVWDKEQQKQTQFACATPLFVFAVEKELEDIIIGDLPDYNADNIVIRHRPKAKPVELIIPRLNLYIER